MSEAISVQAEFEKLIIELEKLKSVNEFATANTASAHSVIEGMDEFISTSKSLQSRIEEQQAQEYVRLTQAIEELNKLSADLVKTKNSLITENSDLLKHHDEAFQNGVKSLTESVNQKTQGLSTELQSATKQLTEKLALSHQASSEQITHVEEAVMSSIENMRSTFAQVQLKQSKQIKLLVVFGIVISLAGASLTLWLLLIRYGII